MNKKIIYAVLLLVLASIALGIMDGIRRERGIEYDETVCVLASDCEDLEHIDCMGEWDCEEHRCSWVCDFESGEETG
jgi:hypothetical protein